MRLTEPPALCRIGLTLVTCSRGEVHGTVLAFSLARFVPGGVVSHGIDRRLIRWRRSSRIYFHRSRSDR